jgi:hypothetical protein
MIKESNFGSKYVSVPPNNISSLCASSREALRGRYLEKQKNLAPVYFS